MRFLRKLLLVLAALVVLLVAAAAIFLATFDANRHRDAVLAQLSATVRRPVEAAQLELQLLPLQLRLNQVRVLEAPETAFAGQEFIRAEAVRFDLSLWSLLRGHPKVLALELDRPTVYLRKVADGQWNFATLGAAPASTPGGEAAPPAAATPPAQAPLRDWRLRAGTLVIEQSGKPPVRLTGVELALTGISLTEPFPFDLAVNFLPESRVQAKGKLGPLNLAAPAATPLQAEVKLEKFRPAALATLVPIPPSLVSLGVFEGSLAVESGPDGLRLSGPLTLAGKDSSDAVVAQLGASFPADFSRVELRDTSLDYRDARLTANGTVALAGAAPGAFDLSLATPPAGADLAALRALPARLGVALPAAIPPVTGTLIADVKVSGTPEDWQLAGAVRLRELSFPLAGLPQPLRVAALELTLTPGRIVAAPFAVSPQAGVNLTVAATVEDYRRAARLQARVSGAEVPLEPLVALAGQSGLKLLGPGQRVSGFARPELELAGPLADPTQLTYRGTVQLREFSLVLPELARPLQVPSASLAFDRQQLTAAPFQVTLEPGVTLTVAGSVDEPAGAARVKARITGDDVSLAPLLGLARRFGFDPIGEGRTLAGRVRPAMEVSGPLAEPAKLTYQGTLGLRDLVFTTLTLAEPVRAAALDLAVTPARLSVEPFLVQLGEKLRARVSFRLENYRTQPSVQARVATESADLEALLALARALGADPLEGGAASGRVTATLDVAGSLVEKAPPLSVSGTAQLSAASVKLAALTAPLSIEQAGIEFSPARLAVTNLRLVAAGSRMQGSLRIENFEAPAVEFNFRGDTLDLDALQALLGSAPPAPPARAPAKTRRVSELFVPSVYAQEQPGGWLAKMTARGRIDFDRVRHGTLTLAPFGAPVQISNQVVACDPVDFGLYDGGGRGRLVLDLRGQEPVTDFNGLLRNVDANQLLSENSDSKDRLYGRLGGTLTVRFAGSERSRLTQSAKGKGQMTLTGGRLARLNLNRELAVLVQSAGLSYQERDTPIEDITTNFDITDGWVRTEDLTVRTPDQTLVAVGGFSLEGELAFAGTSTFTTEASQRMTAGGGGPLGAITGAVTGALFTDDQRRVVVPFTLRGTFAEPKFQFDAARLTEMKRRRSPLRPGGTLGEILDQLRKRP